VEKCVGAAQALAKLFFSPAQITQDGYCQGYISPDHDAVYFNAEVRKISK
jgi:hypothetical protein